MLNRRRLIVTLGGIAGGVLAKGDSLLGQPPAPVCPPKADAVDLAALGLYKAPQDTDDGASRLKQSFLTGMTKKDPNITAISTKVAAHLTASYYDDLDDKVTHRLFKDTMVGGVNKTAKQWVTAIDHAFILGQLAVHFQATKGVVQPRDILRAQAKFHLATSSQYCTCFIASPPQGLGAYELPKAYTIVAGPDPKIDCSPGPKPGQIDEPCPFCD